MQQHHSIRTAAIALLTLATVVTSGWVGDALKGECLFAPWFECGKDGRAILFRGLLAAMAFSASIFLLYLIARRYLPVRHIVRSETRGHQVLIASLSAFDPMPEKDRDGIWRVTARDKDRTPAGAPKSVRLAGGLDEDIEAFSAQAFRWNGQQFLRALHPHIGANTLRHLVLIGSSGGKGSFESLDMATELLARYAPSVHVHRHRDPVSFEDIYTLRKTFDHWVEFFRKRGIPEEEIILDATGGQKTTSIAAALTTLSWGNIEFQYVQTDVNDPHAISFHVIVEIPPMGMGV